MSRKEQQKNLMIVSVAGILITYISIQFMFIKSDLRELEEETIYQQHWIARLEDEIAELRQENHMVKESRYNFSQYDGVGTLMTYEIELSIKKDFSDALSLYYKAFEEEEWRSQPLTVSIGEAKTLIELDTNYN